MNDPFEARAYISHLEAEHRIIESVLAEVESELCTAFARKSADYQRFRDMLFALRQNLEHHFRGEDEGGCLEEAMARCPGLAEEAGDLLAERRGILRLLDHLIVQSDSRMRGCTSADYREAFGRFTRTLRMHEASEKRILNQAFGTGQVERNGCMGHGGHALSGPAVPWDTEPPAARRVESGRRGSAWRVAPDRALGGPC